MRSTGRTSGCGSGASSTACATCWPPDPTTPWPPSTGGSAGSAPWSPSCPRRPGPGARPAPARTASGSTTGRACSCWPASTRAGPAGCWPAGVPPPRTTPKGPDEPAELSYYVCAGPAETTLEQLIAVAGGRWRIEECFQAAKNEAGLASYQVRDYTAWYRHITLAMLAHAYLSATRATAEKGGPQPEPASSSR